MCAVLMFYFFQNLTFLLGPDMGPLDRGGLIQNKSFYSQPVFLVTVSIKSLV